MRYSVLLVAAVAAGVASACSDSNTMSMYECITDLGMGDCSSTDLTCLCNLIGDQKACYTKFCPDTAFPGDEYSSAMEACNLGGDDSSSTPTSTGSGSSEETGSGTSQETSSATITDSSSSSETSATSSSNGNTSGGDDSDDKDEEKASGSGDEGVFPEGDDDEQNNSGNNNNNDDDNNNNNNNNNAPENNAGYTVAAPAGLLLTALVGVAAFL